MNYYKQNFDDLLKTYDLGFLDDYIEYAQRDISNIQNYITAAENQKRIVENTIFACHVYFTREAWSKVFYYVGLKTYPVILENQERITIYKTSECERFTGKEKKRAKEYAEELAKKYNCKITEGGR